MAEASCTEVQCGFCLRKDEALEEPKSLPCNHVHCLVCLTENYDLHGIFRCPFCRYSMPLRCLVLLHFILDATFHFAINIFGLISSWVMLKFFLANRHFPSC